MDRERSHVERFDLTEQLGASPGYAYVARAERGATLYTAGAVPLDKDGAIVGSDIRTQTVAVIDNLVAALGAAGGSPHDVVKTTIYVAAKEQDELVEAWRVFAETELARAPSTPVGVTFLGYSGQLVEIEAVAVTPDAG